MDNVKNNSKNNSKDNSKDVIQENLLNDVAELVLNKDKIGLAGIKHRARQAGVPEIEIVSAEKHANNLLESQRKENLDKAKAVFFDESVGYTGPLWAVDQWYQKGCLHLIAGEKAGAKSTFVMNIIVRNAQKKELWKGHNGDGRKSLYIGERSSEEARDKALAAGGKAQDVNILNEIEYHDGTKVPIDLDNPEHFEIVLKKIKENKYFAVVIDPVVELVLDAQNDNRKMRMAVRNLLREIDGLDTFILGTAHLRKVRSDVSDMGAFRGATELVNMSSAVYRVYDKAEDNRYKRILRLAVNRSKQGTTGCLEFKVEGRNMESTKDKKIYNEGYIKEITELKGSKEMLKKGCKNDLQSKDKPDGFDIVKKIVKKELLRWVKDGRGEHNKIKLEYIKELARAEDGISDHFSRNKITKELMIEWQEELNFDIQDSAFPKAIFLIPR